MERTSTVFFSSFKSNSRYRSLINLISYKKGMSPSCVLFHSVTPLTPNRHFLNTRLDPYRHANHLRPLRYNSLEVPSSA